MLLFSGSPESFGIKVSVCLKGVYFWERVLRGKRSGDVRTRKLLVPYSFCQTLTFILYCLANGTYKLRGSHVSASVHPQIVDAVFICQTLTLFLCLFGNGIYKLRDGQRRFACRSAKNAVFCGERSGVASEALLIFASYITLFFSWQK